MARSKRLETLLVDYRRKRDFTRTGEPDESVPFDSSGHRFVVQKHSASRLHYDFRLELGGVLKSWAVARGPSRDPAQRRLAIRTEDHPIAYADFEGTIPAGQYGGGTVMLWDEGEWEPLHDPGGGLEEGLLHFRLHGTRMRGGWALIRLKPKPKEKQESWLLIKERDDAADDNDALLEDDATSVRTGRTMEQIAEARPAPAPGNPAPAKGRRKLRRKQSNAAVQASTSRSEVAGVRLSHPDKVLYPKQGLTKSDLASYYEAVAQRMLPHISDRPLSLVRCPQGRSGKCFFQKHDQGGFPKAMKAVTITEASGATAPYFYIDSLSGLVAGVQVGVLEFHLWGCRRDRVEQPDRLVFDLDPDEALGFSDVSRAARDVRDRLRALGLTSWPMVTGGKGIHVVIPLARRNGWDEVKGFARGFARQLGEDDPGRYIAKASKASRVGRIFLDWLRNDRGATAICPYSARAREGAPVAMPVSWDELDSLKAANVFTVINAPQRVRDIADPWQDMTQQSLGKKLISRFA